MIAPEEWRTGAAALMLGGPLLGAMIAFVFNAHRAAWLIACVIAAAVAAASVQLLAGGGFATAPLGLRIDSVAGVAAPIIGIAGAACVFAAGHLAPADAGRRGAAMALGLLQIAWFGWIGAAFANDLVTMSAFLIIGWLAACGLSALGAERDRAALSAALRMLIWCGAASVVFAIGAALARYGANAFDLAEIAASQSAAPRARAAGFALMIGAAAVLAVAAPAHAWAPGVFGRGARLASLAIASVGMAAVLTVLARLTLAAAISGEAFAHGVSFALAGLGALSVAIGSLQAIGAADLRRLAAYAGAAQTGAILIALSLGTQAGHAAAFLHMAAWSLIALGLLGGAANIEERAEMSVLDGYGRRAPIAGAAIALGALGLIGTPLTFGFLSRWRLIEAALGSAWWWAAGVMIAGALAAVFYAGRLLERLYVRRIAQERGPWRPSLTPAHALAIVGALALGVNAGALWQAASLAGELMGSAGP